MGNVIAIGNLKGGTGKSTIAVNLACALAESGDAVVLVDADAQATATDWHAGRNLPVAVESLPLGGERDAQRWVARVLSLKASAQSCGGRSAAADRLGHRVRPADRRSVRHSGHPVRRRSARDRQGARSAAPGARGAQLVPPRLHAGAEPGGPAHRGRPAHLHDPRALRLARRSGHSPALGAHRGVRCRRLDRRACAGLARLSRDPRAAGTGSWSCSTRPRARARTSRGSCHRLRSPARRSAPARSSARRSALPSADGRAKAEALPAGAAPPSHPAAPFASLVVTARVRHECVRAPLPLSLPWAAAPPGFALGGRPTVDNRKGGPTGSGMRYNFFW